MIAEHWRTRTKDSVALAMEASTSSTQQLKESQWGENSKNKLWNSLAENK